MRGRGDHKQNEGKEGIIYTVRRKEGGGDVVLISLSLVKVCLVWIISTNILVYVCILYIYKLQDIFSKLWNWRHRP